jgi:hypothetical protein
MKSTGPRPKYSLPCWKPWRSAKCQLPEAQMDRFLMHVMIDYPDDESELEIMRLNREEQKEKKKESTKLSPFLGTWITKAVIIYELSLIFLPS